MSDRGVDARMSRHHTLMIVILDFIPCAIPDTESPNTDFICDRLHVSFVITYDDNASSMMPIIDFLDSPNAYWQITGEVLLEAAPNFPAFLSLLSRSKDFKVKSKSALKVFRCVQQLAAYHTE